MGILDDVLRPHLEEVTKTFGENKCMWLSLIKEKKTNDAKSEKEAELNCVKRNDASEDFRNQGNVSFQAKHFCLAQSLYTQSLASAKEGPLASLAYSNR
jgi:hypothetical protein